MTRTAPTSIRLTPLLAARITASGHTIPFLIALGLDDLDRDQDNRHLLDDLAQRLDDLARIVAGHITRHPRPGPPPATPDPPTTPRDPLASMPPVLDLLDQLGDLDTYTATDAAQRWHVSLSTAQRRINQLIQSNYLAISRLITPPAGRHGPPPRRYRTV